MSRCPAHCATCRSDLKLERETAAQISACRSGPFPVTIEDVDDEDDHPREGAKDLEEGVTMFRSRFGIGTPLQFHPEHPYGFRYAEFPRYQKADFPDLLGMGDGNSSDYAEIEREDCIFTAPEDQSHFVRATTEW